ncbi:hypothetical protein [Streptomyces cinereoruber]|uniref:hypothetical protein n=1 Tax=Streptomyces cinereoruber TaxID=67260 RepID=UPI000786C8E9|nr:hypothetical protein C5L38_20090 [Streptomyces sp. WAC00288]KYG55689.1 hypothetical protein AWI43_15745 [Streptomyces sp. WAC04657]PVC65222.1 hypothetical protein DBP18_31635 [Streptomyces sp. CS081A]
MKKRRKPVPARVRPVAHALVTGACCWASVLWLVHGEPPALLPDRIPVPLFLVVVSGLMVDSARALVRGLRDRRPEPPYSPGS